MKNSAITLFGGSGDLTYRKLIPAMYNLHVLKKLPTNFKIIAIGRRPYDTTQYISIVKDWVSQYARKKFDEEQFNEFSSRITYFKMDISQIEQYEQLQQYFVTQNIEKHIYYYAVAPSFFIPITEGLAKYSAHNDAKVIIEKPFGEDLPSAQKLNTILADFFGQDEIYHIDHYLGKEMIQNILSIRFQNTVFREIWNNRFIHSVQISAAESDGVGTRGGYYDKSGALKDMVQNHLLQVLSIVAMEEPSSNYYTDEQLNVLKCLMPIEDIHSQVVLGQYEGYLEKENIAENSTTETFAALKLMIDNPRWKNVPFYIKTGKKLKERETQVIIRFKSISGEPENILRIKVQPDEGVYFQFNAKKPGTENELQTVSMDFCQNCVIENRMNTPEAYERLLYACMNDDRSLFSKWDQIETSWDFMYEIIQKKSQLPLHRYPQNSAGPESALTLTDWLV